MSTQYVPYQPPCRQPPHLPARPVSESQSQSQRLPRAFPLRQRHLPATFRFRSRSSTFRRPPVPLGPVVPEPHYQPSASTASLEFRHLDPFSLNSSQVATCLLPYSKERWTPLSKTDIINFINLTSLTFSRPLIVSIPHSVPCIQLRTPRHNPQKLPSWRKRQRRTGPNRTPPP